MNQYALFLGCNIPVRVKQYDVSARMVLKELGVSLVDIRQFNCCGLLLAEEGLEYNGNVKIKHFLSVLYHDVGIDTIKQQISTPYKNFNIATHYGCHVLRPSRVTQFDDPVNPSLIDELVTVTGAKSVDWPLQLECCGAPVMGIDDDLSENLTKKKLIDAKAAGAHYVCTACPYCHIQFDTVQKRILSENGNQDDALPAILYPQLLGLGMGIDGDLLGISDNEMDISRVTSFLSEE